MRPCEVLCGLVWACVGLCGLARACEGLRGLVRVLGNDKAWTAGLLAAAGCSAGLLGMRWTLKALESLDSCALNMMLLWGLCGHFRLGG